jgi:two-component system, NarL family, invasion response regulator UvrY
MHRILLADDHPVVRRGLLQILTEAYPSCVIGEANDGEKLLKKVMQYEWDIVISDLIMPGRSGLDVLEDIKRIKPNLPVLIISIYSEELYALRVLKAGAAGYVKKDLAPEELVNAVNMVMTGRRYITESVANQLTHQLSIDRSIPLHELLSDREFEVFRLIASGKTVLEISSMISVSPSTVSTYRSRIMTKMHFKTNADLTIYATRMNLLS